MKSVLACFRYTYWVLIRYCFRISGFNGLEELRRALPGLWRKLWKLLSRICASIVSETCLHPAVPAPFPFPQKTRCD